MIGDTLGPWTLTQELGRGGMGTVYLAKRETDEPKKAALKILALEWSTDPEQQKRFQREIDVLRKLKHPNIVRLLDSGIERGRSYYVMEHVEGPTYQQLMDAGRLEWEPVLDMALQVCLALKHAHNHGIIHRDLKPSNLLRGVPLPDAKREGRFGVVKLSDFGIAWVFSEPHLTRPGAVLGSAEHISPEQAAGKKPSKKSDIYSLGSVMYALLTGRPAFQGEIPDLLHKHRYAQFDPPRKVAPDVPPDLDEVICEMMSKEPDQRPPDAGALFRRLDSIRRKYERKAAQRTSPDHSGRDTAVEQPPQEDGAELMAELMREELHRQNRGGPVQRFFNHPLVLILLFLATVGAIVWTFWPESRDSLYQRGAELMATEDPDQWYEAEEVFNELDERFPEHPYGEEVKAFREEIRAERAARRAESKAKQAEPISEARWFYELGARLHQQGKTEEAKRMWRNLALAFAEVPEEAPWVRKAEEALENPVRAGAHDSWKTVRQALEQIEKLKGEEAERARKALAELYADDPSADPILNP